jgi:hypothetical protein
MGLSYDELYDLTPRSFSNKLLGYNNYQEQLMQDRWERTRLIIQSSLAPHSKKKLKPKEILPFPWDSKRDNKPNIASREHIQSVIEKYEKIKLQKQNGGN